MRTLVVADKTFMIAKLRYMLKNYNLEVVGVSNSFLALDAYRRLLPDVVIFCVGGFDMHEIDMIKKIKKINNNIDILTCNLKPKRQLVLQSIESGDKDFIAISLGSEGRINSIIHTCNLKS